jgi:hypothetical protein
MLTVGSCIYLLAIDFLTFDSYTAWNSITEEDLKDLDSFPGMFVYMSGKTIAERKLWEIAEKHPDVDLTTSKFAVKVI